jgi:hypothetical protein
MPKQGYLTHNKGRRVAILSIEAGRNSRYIYKLRNLLVKYSQTNDLAPIDAQICKNASLFDSIGTWCWQGLETRADEVSGRYGLLW